MVFVKLDDNIKRLLSSYNEENSEPKIQDKIQYKDYLDYQYIKLMVDKLNKFQVEEKQYIHKLVRPDMIFYTLELAEMEYNQQPNPEFEEYKKRLLVKRQEKDYQKMVKNITPSSKDTGNLLGFEVVKDMNKSMSMALSYLLTLFASGLSGYYVAKFFGYDQVNCLVVGFVFLIITLIMETTLFIIKTGYDKSKIDSKLNSNNKKQQ